MGCSSRWTGGIVPAVRDERDRASELPSSYEAGASPGSGEGASDRSRAVTLALAFLGGVFGLHRFYTGRLQSGIWMALTFGGLGIWYLYDLILVATGEFRDGAGLRVLRWDLTDVAVVGAPSILLVVHTMGGFAP